MEITMKALFTLLICTLISGHIIAAEINSSKLPGYQFSLVDIEKNCQALRAGTDSLTISCKGDHLKAVRRSCEGFIINGLENVRLNCGGGLWILNTKCKILMRGANKGEFDCKL
jgi:hypothetical protein